MSLAAQIAELVHQKFNALPARSKPRAQPNGVREWVPLAGVVLVREK